MSRARPFCEKHPDAYSDSCMVCLACDEEGRMAIERVKALEAALREINNDPRASRWAAGVAFAALEGK